MYEAFILNAALLDGAVNGQNGSEWCPCMMGFGGFMGGFFGLIWMLLWIVIIVAIIYAIIVFVRNLSAPRGGAEPRQEDLSYELRSLKRELEELRRKLDEKGERER